MRDNVFQEYKEAIHYKIRPASARSALTAMCRRIGCTKCTPSPKPAWRLWDKIVGTIGTKEKFEEHRLELAQIVWGKMRASGSRECRNCLRSDGHAEPGEAGAEAA